MKTISIWMYGICEGRHARKHRIRGKVQHDISGKWFTISQEKWLHFTTGNHEAKIQSQQVICNSL
jgi:hypothetical protein